MIYKKYVSSDGKIRIRIVNASTLIEKLFLDNPAVINPMAKIFIGRFVVASILTNQILKEHEIIDQDLWLQYFASNISGMQNIYINQENQIEVDTTIQKRLFNNSYIKDNLDYEVGKYLIDQNSLQLGVDPSYLKAFTRQEKNGSNYMPILNKDESYGVKIEQGNISHEFTKLLKLYDDNPNFVNLGVIYDNNQIYAPKIAAGYQIDFDKDLISPEFIEKMRQLDYIKNLPDLEFANVSNLDKIIKEYVEKSMGITLEEDDKQYFWFNKVNNYCSSPLSFIGTMEFDDDFFKLFLLLKFPMFQDINLAQKSLEFYIPRLKNEYDKLLEKFDYNPIDVINSLQTKHQWNNEAIGVEIDVFGFLKLNYYPIEELKNTNKYQVEGKSWQLVERIKRVGSGEVFQNNVLPVNYIIEKLRYAILNGESEFNCSIYNKKTISSCNLDELFDLFINIKYLHSLES